MKRYDLVPDCNVMDEKEDGDYVFYDDAIAAIQQSHRAATEEVANAHRRGWEQCQREAEKAARDSHHDEGCFCDWCGIAHNAASAIAKMGYKEPTNDKQ